MSSFFKPIKSRHPKATKVEQQFVSRQESRGVNTSGPDNKNDKNHRGIFYKARHFLLYKPIMIDGFHSPQITYSVPGSENLKTMFDILRPSTILEATVDSSARHPPPRCHPGTRKHLADKLDSWLINRQRQWDMLWLRGPAGTGKSAVAQSFAERAGEQGRLGAAFFFSRVNERNNPLRVIPTIVYQLAEQWSDYKSLLTQQLVENSRVLSAVLRVQFRKLIVEPLSSLAKNSQQPLLIVLDGLDECEGEDSQREIIKLVCEAAHPENGLPLLWLICSRPEPHIINTFSTIDSSINCCREQLVLDDDSRNDVDRYLRDSFVGICNQYPDVVGAQTGQCWPSDGDFAKISNAASGLFTFAATALKYITDPEFADPCHQLRLLLSFIDKSQSLGAKNPWEALDLLYTCILSDVAKHILPTTLLILGFCIRGQQCIRAFPYVHAQALCNFLRLDQGTFYVALRKLHAVVEVPSPEEAHRTKLRFHHASFGDYLQDSTRSGKYFIDNQAVNAKLATYALHWGAACPKTEGPSGWTSSKSYATHFLWPPSSSEEDMHGRIALTAMDCLKRAYERADHGGKLILFSQIRQCHFTNFLAIVPLHMVDGLGNMFYQLSYREDFGGKYIRVEASNSEDARLLGYLSDLSGPGVLLIPAQFPIGFPDYDLNPGEVHYFFMGHGSRSCIVCLSCRPGNWQSRILRVGELHSEEEISDFRQYMDLLPADSHRVCGGDDSEVYK